MHLKGWTKPLPDWIVEAIKGGNITVWYSKKDDCELLKGETVNPHGVIVGFK